MPGDGPAIKFSPFEALLIGEHNNIIKRKPMKNTVYLTNLNHRRREFNLRELFDVKDDVKDCDGDKKKVKKIQRHKGNESKFHSFRLRQNQKKKKEKRVKKKSQPNKVRFKPDFRFRETLEERIVQKIQKRKKKLKTNLVGNGVICQLRKPHPNRHSLRGKNGQFIRREDSEKAEPGSLSKYLKNLYAVKGDGKKRKVNRSNKQRKRQKVESPESDNSDSNRAKYFTESVLNDISLQYYRNVFPKEFGFPMLPDEFETTDFEQDNDLRGILDESNKDEGDKDGDAKREQEEEELNPPGSDIQWRKKGLRRYERKKTDKSDTANFGKKAKENHFVSRNTRSNSSIKNNAVPPTKRNGVNCLIDERPAKSNHLIWNNKFRSLFYKTAFGSEMYLGNLNKSVVLNSTFGRLPDVS